MEIEKAIEILQHHKRVFGLPEQGSKWKPNADTIACDVAIQALEKQAGKRPESEYDDEFVCPSCETYHEGYDVTTIKYCPDCGQKIDWS